MNLTRLATLTFALLLSISSSRAGTGGAELWKVKIKEGPQQYYPEIKAIGDDGVVVMNLGSEIVEIDSRVKAAPATRVLNLPETTYAKARVNGRTYAMNEQATKLAWVGAEGAAVTVDSSHSNGDANIGANGEVYSSSWDGRAYLTKWAVDGSLVRRQAIGPIGTGLKAVYSGPAILGTDGTIFVSLSDGTLLAFAEDGREKWRTTYSAWQAVIPTAEGGVLVSDSLARMVRFSSNGVPEAIVGHFRQGDSWALTPGDTLLSSLDYIGETENPRQIAGLADGGIVFISSHKISRLDNLGIVIWQRDLMNAYTSFKIGNGFVIIVEQLYDAPSARYSYWLSAVDLGAGLMESAWPTSDGNPDGTRRAWSTHHSPPTITLVRHSAQGGVVLNFGVRVGRTYTVEAADSILDSWKPIGTVIGEGFGAQYHDPTRANQIFRHFRVTEHQ